MIRRGVPSDRAHLDQRVEADHGPDAAVDAEGVDTGRGQLRARRSRASCRPSRPAPRRRSSRRGPAGRTRRAPPRSPISSSSRSLAVSSMSRSTPPSRRPSICSRYAARTSTVARPFGAVDRRPDRTDGAGDEHVTAAHVARLAGQLRGAAIDGAGPIGEAERGQAEAVGTEGVGLDDVRAGLRRTRGGWRRSGPGGSRRARPATPAAARRG